MSKTKRRRLDFSHSDQRKKDNQACITFFKINLRKKRYLEVAKGKPEWPSYSQVMSTLLLLKICSFFTLFFLLFVQLLYHLFEFRYLLFEFHIFNSSFILFLSEFHTFYLWFAPFIWVSNLSFEFHTFYFRFHTFSSSVLTFIQVSNLSF